MEVFEKDQMRQSLSQLESWKQIAFMALCCERMVPNYEQFAAETSFGDPLVLRLGLGAAWSWLVTRQVPDHLNTVRMAVEQQTPDTTNFASPFTSAALDAVNAVACLLDALVNPEIADPVEVAVLSYDTVDIYVQEIEDLDPREDGFEDRILSHPLMQKELRRQREDLSYLEHWNGSQIDGARLLREQRQNSLGSLSDS